MRELPGREPRSLQHRSCLVHIHVHPPPRLVGEVDRGERRADTAGRERPGVAMRQDRGAVGHERETGFPDATAHRAILLPDRRRLALQPVPQRGALAGRLRGHAAHAIERPPQVDRRGTSGGEGGGQLLDPRQEALARSATLVPEPRDEPHGRRDPDERRPPYLQRPDRLGHRGGAFEVPLDVGFGERPLVHDAHGPAPGPGDGLDGHEQEANAECGVRSALRKHLE